MSTPFSRFDGALKKEHRQAVLEERRKREAEPVHPDRPDQPASRQRRPAPPPTPALMTIAIRPTTSNGGATMLLVIDAAKLGLSEEQQRKLHAVAAKRGLTPSQYCADLIREGIAREKAALLERIAREKAAALG